MASINNFINYKDFDVKNLRLCEGRASKSHNYRTYEIKYAFPDGKTRNLRLRSPVLFSYGIKKFQKAPDYFISLKSFYDKENPTKKEIVKDSGFFFPKLVQDRSYDVGGNFTGGKIETVFYEKLADGNTAVVVPTFIEKRNCYVVALIDITDIFVKSPVVKVRTYLSDVIVINKDVPAPSYRVKMVGLKLDSEDER